MSEMTERLDAPRSLHHAVRAHERWLADRHGEMVVEDADGARSRPLRAWPVAVSERGVHE